MRGIVAAVVAYDVMVSGTGWAAICGGPALPRGYSAWPCGKLWLLACRVYTYVLAFRAGCAYCVAYPLVTAGLCLWGCWPPCIDACCYRKLFARSVMPCCGRCCLAPPRLRFIIG